MSDQSSRDARDPAMQVANELRANLRAMRGEDLIELAANLLNTYVVEGVVPLARAGESTDLAADAVGEETFAQLLKRLKASKRDPVLDRFLIDGENISVRIDGQGVMPITEYRRPTGTPAGAGGQQAQPQQRREGVPGGATSIYNRGLYQPEQQQAAPPPAQLDVRMTPTRPSTPAQQRTSPPQQQPAQPAQQKQPPGQPQKEEPKSDRFSLIELE